MGISIGTCNGIGRGISNPGGVGLGGMKPLGVVDMYVDGMNGLVI